MPAIATRADALRLMAWPLSVTGTCDPDVTGKYQLVGEYTNHSCYRRGSDDWYIWLFPPMPPPPRWIISTSPGLFGEAWFYSLSLHGQYAPYGSASGTPVVSLGEVRHLVAVGTIPGVVLLAAAGRNGPAAGGLRSTGDGTLLSWQAPGSSTYGTSVDCSSDGFYLLEDGEDLNKWIRVQVYMAHLTPGPAEAKVYLADRFTNAIGHLDVTAAEAQSGDVLSWMVTMLNAGDRVLENILVWITSGRLNLATLTLDELTALTLDELSELDLALRLEISKDDSTWVGPADELSALRFDPLQPAEDHILHLRRTVPAGDPPDPEILNTIACAYDARYLSG